MLLRLTQILLNLLTIPAFYLQFFHFQLIISSWNIFHEYISSNKCICVVNYLNHIYLKIPLANFILE